MSFGPSQAQKNSNNQANAITGEAISNSNAANAAGTNLLNAGQGNVTQGTNFLSTVLGGNSANTAALLAPSINQTRATDQNAIQSASALQPRGGGRSASLFNAQLSPAAGVQNLFNSARTTAATTLPQIGIAQEGVGTNLFNVGNSALNTGSSTNASLSQALAQQQQQMLQTYAGLGSGLFGLLTAPLTGGTSALGSLAGLFSPSPSNPQMALGGT